MKKLFRRYYDCSPEIVKKGARKLKKYIQKVVRNRRDNWIRNVYTKFGHDQVRYIFLSIARFCHINRPMNGYYFEFGSHEANTMRMAFDSFEGLPEIAEIDEQEIWEKGKLKTTEGDFVRIVTKHGVPREKLITVKGFYDTSLDEQLKKKLLPAKAAVIYIDCDLYTSTVPVLNFVKDFLQRGTIVVFDDWNCFHGDPDKGERRAFREFRERHPELIFEDFIQTNEAKAFIFLGG